MSTNTRDIRRRIRAVTSTKKITKAMELVASAKMRKVTQALLATRPYTDHAWELLRRLSEHVDPNSHPLFQSRPVKRQALAIMSTNRGLVGAFNTNLLNTAVEYSRSVKERHGAETDVILIGTKGRAIVYRYGYTAAADFPKEEVVTNVLAIRPIASFVTKAFLAGTYDRIAVAFMDYRSTLLQKPRVRQLIPLDRDAFAFGQIEEGSDKQSVVNNTTSFEYAFEPSTGTVLDQILRRLVEVQIFRALLETNASEQAARMMAMRNATDAASDLIDDLTLTFNQARQAAITKDLAEISAGRAALEL